MGWRVGSLKLKLEARFLLLVMLRCREWLWEWGVEIVEGIRLFEDRWLRNWEVVRFWEVYIYIYCIYSIIKYLYLFYKEFL